MVYGRSARARVAAGGDADVAGEGGAEGAGGGVADALGDFVDGEVVAAEEVFGDGHAPGEERSGTTVRIVVPALLLTVATR